MQESSVSEKAEEKVDKNDEIEVPDDCSPLDNTSETIPSREFLATRDEVLKVLHKGKKVTGEIVFLLVERPDTRVKNDAVVVTPQSSFYQILFYISKGKRLSTSTKRLLASPALNGISVEDFNTVVFDALAYIDDWYRIKDHMERSMQEVYGSAVDMAPSTTVNVLSCKYQRLLRLLSEANGIAVSLPGSSEMDLSTHTLSLDKFDQILNDAEDLLRRWPIMELHESFHAFVDAFERISSDDTDHGGDSLLQLLQDLEGGGRAHLSIKEAWYVTQLLQELTQMAEKLATTGQVIVSSHVAAATTIAVGKLVNGTYSWLGTIAKLVESEEFSLLWKDSAFVTVSREEYLAVCNLLIIHSELYGPINVVAIDAKNSEFSRVSQEWGNDNILA